MQNLLLTTFTPLKNTNEITSWENRPFATVWPEYEQNEGDSTRKIIKNKTKRARTAYTTYQLQVLEMKYSYQKYVDKLDRVEIAKNLKISEKCVKIWFQNRRMKEKKESSESSNDSSSESVCIKSSLVPASPSFKVIIDKPAPQELPQYPDSTYQGIEYLSAPTSTTMQEIIDQPSTEKFAQYTNSTYQLPTYYNTNEGQSSYANVPRPDFATYFSNGNNEYPTQYYPHNVNYSREEGSGYNQYASEVKNCWPENEKPHYSTI